MLGPASKGSATCLPEHLVALHEPRQILRVCLNVVLDLIVAEGLAHEAVRQTGAARHLHLDLNLADLPVEDAWRALLG